MATLRWRQGRSHLLRARGFVLRPICLAITACTLAPAGPALAQAPAADSYEPNDAAQIATAIDPRQPYSATIGPAGDVDWYGIQGSAPSWQKFFASDDRRIEIIVARTQDDCARQSLRVTLYTGTGQLVTSSPVYPGPAASILTIKDIEPGGAYGLLVDTALDPACVAAVPYTIRAEPYAPPPPQAAPPFGQARPPIKVEKNAAKCEIYSDKAVGQSNRIDDLKRRKAGSRKQRGKRRQRIRKLQADRRRFQALAKAYCGH